MSRRLGRLGYRKTRQTGSHIRLSVEFPNRVHHITVPDHDSLRVGTLSGILKDVAEHLGVPKSDLIRKLWR